MNAITSKYINQTLIEIQEENKKPIVMVGDIKLSNN